MNENGRIIPCHRPFQNPAIVVAVDAEFAQLESAMRIPRISTMFSVLFNFIFYFG